MLIHKKFWKLNDLRFQRKFCLKETKTILKQRDDAHIFRDDFKYL